MFSCCQALKLSMCTIPAPAGSMEQLPWEYYFSIFSGRAARVPDVAFGRAELLYEVAHDAYQDTSNHLTDSGWNEEEALMVTRIFGQVVKDWLARDGADLDQLRDRLRLQYDEWQR